jgi:hypothetical protein
MYGLAVGRGRRDLADDPGDAKIVTTYGSMSMNSLGIGVRDAEQVLQVAKPNSSAASVALIGSHDRR